MTICVLAAVLALSGATALGQITVLHDFAGGSLGERPEGSPIIDGATLYATTLAGGTYNQGTVFKINTDGTGFTVLHEFEGEPNDGRNPESRLALGGGTLYGTTGYGGYGGGLYGMGTVFKVNTDGTGYSVLLHFYKDSTGRNPHGGVTLHGGKLYGTTFYGQGYSGDGNIYKINTDGTGFTEIHSFNSDPLKYPRSDVIISGNTIYTMVSASGPDYMTAYGAVVKVETDGTGFAVIHTFAGGVDDGRAPYYGAMTLDGSVLYGMTVCGGDDDKGTVFKVNTDGTGYSLLHEFGAASDGAKPYGQPTLVGNTLYGMTYDGGAHNKGTVFKVDTDGTGYSVVHDFNNTDGANPYESFVLHGSSLYGLATYGGSTGADGGVIFKLAPLSMASLAVGSGTVTFTDNGLAAGGYSTQGMAGGTLPSTVSIQNLVLSGGMATLKVIYSPTVLVDEGIDEATFRLYWYDTSTSQWLLAGRNSNNNQTTGSDQGDSTPTAVLGDWGIDMTNNYLWANIDHASTFAMAGGAAAGDFVAPAGVDMSDFAVLAGQWLSTPGSPSADIAEPLDNFVDIADLAVFCDNWLVGTE